MEWLRRAIANGRIEPLYENPAAPSSSAYTFTGKHRSWQTETSIVGRREWVDIEQRVRRGGLRIEVD